MEKRKLDIGPQPSSKNAKISNKEKRPVVERVIAAAPVRYAPPPPPPKNSKDRDQIPGLNVLVPPPLIEARPFQGLQGIAYQDALKLLDSSQPQYLYPQYAPKGGNQQSSKKWMREAGGTVWEDPTLADWDPSDHRIFVGNLGNEVHDEVLVKAFMKYPSFQRAKVIKDRRSGKSKGYGFVSFTEAEDFAKAVMEMNGKYIGNRPCKISKSSWKERATDDTKPPTQPQRQKKN